MNPRKSKPQRFHFLALAGLIFGMAAGAATLPPGFAEARIASGLNPVTMSFAPDGRLFFCEKHGLLRVVKDGKLLEKPFLDLTGKVDAWNERGLLSVCFDPDFASNGWVYVYYTHNRDPEDASRQSSNNRVSRFTAKGDVAQAGSEKVLLEIDNLSKIGWHNGGGLAFGKDGKLYVSTGENAKGPNARDPGNLLGKLLRINRDGSIPADNPHFGTFKDKNRAIVAMGLRNAFHLAVQPGSGLLYVSEVGANFEQIERYDTSSRKPEAVDYGWPEIDGPRRDQKPPAGYREPEHPYDHGKGKGLALCGGDFYNPARPGPGAFPAEYTGRFFFGDYGGWIKSIDPARPDQRHDFAEGINRALDVAVAPDGTLWYLERAGIPGGSDEANSASKDGSLWQVRWTGNGGGQVARLAVIRQPGAAPVGAPLGEVQVALQDAEGKILTTLQDRVTVQIEANPGSGKLLGTRTVAAVKGVAKFTSLAIDQPGMGYTLSIRSGGLSASSGPFDIAAEVAKPSISPGGGRFSGPLRVRLASATPGATIHFTRDGGRPDASSPVYEEPFEVTASSQIQAIAMKKGLGDSGVAEAGLNIEGSTPYGMNLRPPVSGLKLPATAEEGLPATLSATGIFTDGKLTPIPGGVPYGLSSTVWADGAEVRRWVLLPGDSKVGFSPAGNFTWPGGTVFVQHFEIETDLGTKARRRLETRLLVLDASGSFGYGANYRWRADGKDADLVKPAGEEETLVITGKAGETREQVWSYPASGLCFMCHTPTAGFVLGPKTRQLNGSFDYPGGRSDNQLRTWNALQMFTPELEESAIASYPKTCKIDDPTASLDERVRSYLDANCAACHQPGGTGAGWDARYETPLAGQGILNGQVRNNLGIPDARLVVPGDVAKSMMHRRMASDSLTERMPPVTRNLPDAAALELLEAWIKSKPAEE